MWLLYKGILLINTDTKLRIEVVNRVVENDWVLSLSVGGNETQIPNNNGITAFDMFNKIVREFKERDMVIEI